MTKYQVYVQFSNTYMVELESDPNFVNEAAIRAASDFRLGVLCDKITTKVTPMADGAFKVTDKKVVTKAYRVLIEKTFHYTVEVDAENADEAEKEATDQLEASHAPNEYLDDEGDYEATDVTVID